jgi:hypothetical protein
MDPLLEEFEFSGKWSFDQLLDAAIGHVIGIEKDSASKKLMTKDWQKAVGLAVRNVVKDKLSGPDLGGKMAALLQDAKDGTPAVVAGSLSSFNAAAAIVNRENVDNKKQHIDVKHDHTATAKRMLQVLRLLIPSHQFTSMVLAEDIALLRQMISQQSAEFESMRSDFSIFKRGFSDMMKQVDGLQRSRDETVAVRGPENKQPDALQAGAPVQSSLGTHQLEKISGARKECLWRCMVLLSKFWDSKSEALVGAAREEAMTAAIAKIRPAVVHIVRNLKEAEFELIYAGLQREAVVSEVENSEKLGGIELPVAVMYLREVERLDLVWFDKRNQNPGHFSDSAKTDSKNPVAFLVFKTDTMYKNQSNNHFDLFKTVFTANDGSIVVNRSFSPGEKKVALESFTKLFAQLISAKKPEQKQGQGPSPKSESPKIGANAGSGPSATSGKKKKERRRNKGQNPAPTIVVPPDLATRQGSVPAFVATSSDKSATPGSVYTLLLGTRKFAAGLIVSVRPAKTNTSLFFVGSENEAGAAQLRAVFPTVSIPSLVLREYVDQPSNASARADKSNRSKKRDALYDKIGEIVQKKVEQRLAQAAPASRPASRSASPSRLQPFQVQQNQQPAQPVQYANAWFVPVPYQQQQQQLQQQQQQQQQQQYNANAQQQSSSPFCTEWATHGSCSQGGYCPFAFSHK